MGAGKTQQHKQHITLHLAPEGEEMWAGRHSSISNSSSTCSSVDIDAVCHVSPLHVCREKECGVRVYGS